MTGTEKVAAVVLTANRFALVGATPEQVAAFEGLFPGGMVPSAENLERAASAGLHVFGPLDAQAREAYAPAQVAAHVRYQSLVRPLLDEYRALADANSGRQWLAWDRYFALDKTAREEYNRACREAMAAGIAATLGRERDATLTLAAYTLALMATPLAAVEA